MKRTAVLSALSSIALVIGVLTLGPVPSANADAASVPFYGSKLLKGKCSDPGSYRKVRTVKRPPTEADTPNWHQVDTTTDAAGYFKTFIYVKNSYRNFEVGVVCNIERNKYRTTTPITYLHKTRYVNFNCYGMSCRHLYTRTTGWAKGYCMRGSDGKVCSFD